MRGPDAITVAMDVTLGKLQEMLRDREALRAAAGAWVPGAALGMGRAQASASFLFLSGTQQL